MWYHWGIKSVKTSTELEIIINYQFCVQFSISMKAFLGYKYEQEIYREEKTAFNLARKQGIGYWFFFVILANN